MTTLEKSVADFIAWERSRGIRQRGRDGILNEFVRCLRKRNEIRISTENTKSYLDLRASLAPATKSLILSIIRSFARYRILYDPKTEIPTRRLLPIARQRFSPHIYSQEDLEKILYDSCQFKGKLSFAYVSHWAAVGTMAVTGLRSGEACGLLIRDVNLEEGLLRIRKGKGMRERIVPIHPTTSRILTSYFRSRCKAGRATEDDPFFCSTRGTPLRPGEILRKFQNSLSRLKIVNAAGRLPRVHDLRHTYATDSVTRFHGMQGDPNAKLPILSAALGHEHFRHTYQYTSFSPGMQANALAKVNSYVL
jgi:integrase